jgi:hypothetical protein
MQNKDKFFGRILGVDQHLLRLEDDNFSLRFCGEYEATLFSLTGTLVRLVNKELENAPNTIVCEKLPELSVHIIERDGWSIKDGKLVIPYLTQLDLQKARPYTSDESIVINDFPGHMKTIINRRMRQSDFAKLKPLEEKLDRLAQALNETLTESVEIPLINVVGRGEGKLRAGDAALCAMILTARCFAISPRFKIDWFNRLSVETRRLLHRTEAVGKNWLKFALDGRMTERQQKFFRAMAKDFEGADELVINEVAAEESLSGRAFVLGVHFALEMIYKKYFKN